VCFYSTPKLVAIVKELLYLIDVANALREQGKLLLQQRAESKITFPSYWTNTCCSHPLYRLPAEAQTTYHIDHADELEETNQLGRLLEHHLSFTIDIDLSNNNKRGEESSETEASSRARNQRRGDRGLHLSHQNPLQSRIRCQVGRTRRYLYVSQSHIATLSN